MFVAQTSIGFKIPLEKNKYKNNTNLNNFKKFKEIKKKLPKQQLAKYSMSIMQSYTKLIQ